jgi:hypothetical protein
MPGLFDDNIPQGLLQPGGASGGYFDPSAAGLLGGPFRPGPNESFMTRIFGTNDPRDPRGNAMSALAVGLLRHDLASGFEGANRAFSEAEDRNARRAANALTLNKSALELASLRQGIQRSAAIQGELAAARQPPGAAASPNPAAPTMTGPDSFGVPSVAGIPMFGLAGPSRMPTMAPSAAASAQPGVARPATGLTPANGGAPGQQAIYNDLVRTAQIYARYGDDKTANAYFERAAQFRQKFATEPRVMTDPATGRVGNFLVSEDGEVRPLAYGVKPDIELKDTGGDFTAVDKNNVGAGFRLQKTGNPFSDLVLRDSNGGLVPNGPLVAVKKQISSAGATQVKIENKLGEGVAAQVGPMLRESYTAANGAAQTIDAADRLVSAVDSGKLYAGPGASSRLKLAQVSQALGIGGKDDQERIANTRQAVRALAEMTLQGRKQMSGQGAITDKESGLSGDISDLTVPEIRLLADASSRAAKFIYDQHLNMVSNLSQDANTAGLAKFYKPMPLPKPRQRMLQSGPLGAQPPAGSTPMIDSLVEKYAR